jgi:pyruvoyl-dependent arginine decarboxylase (PvlArgDC)
MILKLTLTLVAALFGKSTKKEKEREAVIGQAFIEDEKWLPLAMEYLSMLVSERAGEGVEQQTNISYDEERQGFELTVIAHVPSP